MFFFLLLLLLILSQPGSEAGQRRGSHTLLFKKNIYLTYLKKKTEVDHS